ncbi:MAG: hypothetical protein IJP86_05820 [Synergistaceae bacterium]|nr:hypothetical protein [Synergistaceae bacterium]
MSEIFTNEARTDNRTLNKQVETATASFTNYIDDSTDPEEPEPTAEDSTDAPLEANEESDDDEGGEYHVGAEAFSIQPIWILYEGQILWAASRYGFNLASKEYFRRRIQLLLDFLVRKFPGKSYGELLLSLQGFFVRDGESSKGRWLDSLKNSGILFFDERAKKYRVIPLSDFRADKGQGKGLPGKMEALWLEHEFSKINASVSRKDFEKYKAGLFAGFKDFCAELNELCSVFDSQEDEGETKQSIGLKKIDFVYDESTLGNKLTKWKKLWSKR